MARPQFSIFKWKKKSLVTSGHLKMSQIVCCLTTIFMENKQKVIENICVVLENKVVSLSDNNYQVTKTNDFERN